MKRFLRRPSSGRYDPKSRLGLALALLLAIAAGYRLWPQARSQGLVETATVEAIISSWQQQPQERAANLQTLHDYFRAQPQALLFFKDTFLQTALLADQRPIVEQWLHWPATKPLPPAGSLSPASPFIKAIDLQQKIALEISAKQWQEALQSCGESLELAQDLLRSAAAAQSRFWHLLVLQLKMQQALVYQQLGESLREQQAWQELLALAKGQQAASLQEQAGPVSQAFFDAYGQKSASLVDYIAWRLHHLQEKA